jgi:hypothetical protein
MRRIYRIAVAAGVLEALGAAYSFAVLPRLRRWGATPEEASRPLPGDDLVAGSMYTTTRAITIDAPPEAVFPWLVQLGQSRGGFYTYDVLENLARLKIHSADRIHPEWQDLAAGRDYVTLDPDEYMKMTIAVLEPPRAFVIRTGGPDDGPQSPGDFFKGEIDGSWAFVVEPAGAGRARLIVRWRAAWRPSVPAAFARAFGLEPVHFFMEEGMLRGIRGRAERAAAGA